MGENIDFSDKKNVAYLTWQTVMIMAIVYTTIESPLSFILKTPIKESHAWWDLFNPSTVLVLFFRQFLVKKSLLIFPK